MGFAFQRPECMSVRDPLTEGRMLGAKRYPAGLASSRETINTQGLVLLDPQHTGPQNTDLNTMAIPPNLTQKMHPRPKKHPSCMPSRPVLKLERCSIVGTVGLINELRRFHCGRTA